MTRRLLVSLTKLTGGHDASVKPRTDIEHFLAGDECSAIDIPININSKLGKAIGYYWTLQVYLREAIAGAAPQVVYIQYPAYSSVLMDRALKIIRHDTSAKIVLIVHDVESLRMSKDKPEFLTAEVQRFNSADGLIVHNQAMEHWLQSHGVKTPMAKLNLFDYQNPQPIIDHANDTGNVCFAGNLRKAQFLNDIPFSKLKIDVFGDGLELTNSQLIDRGSKSPDELPKYLHDKFGLIWDGESVDTCSGDYGEYLKYNSPHKASLYISSGLPVIVWSQSALAPFVKQQHLGIVIDSLNDLEQVINQLPDHEYQQMIEFVTATADQLRNGHSINAAVAQIEERLD